MVGDAYVSGSILGFKNVVVNGVWLQAGDGYCLALVFTMAKSSSWEISFSFFAVIASFFLTFSFSLAKTFSLTMI